MSVNKGKGALNREVIINAALDLIDQQKGISGIGLREIARKLGCAHTNLYNYFTDLDSLFWNAIQKVVFMLSEAVTSNDDPSKDGIARLSGFYTRFLDFYLLHPGWFRLVWIEPVQGKRPDSHSAEYLMKTDRLTHFLHEIYPEKLSREAAYDLLHQIHCYLHGEVNIFLAGRGIYHQTDLFRNYVIPACTRMTRLLME